jgi:hypothetical protein
MKRLYMYIQCKFYCSKDCTYIVLVNRTVQLGIDFFNYMYREQDTRTVLPVLSMPTADCCLWTKACEGCFCFGEFFLCAEGQVGGRLSSPFP